MEQLPFLRRLHIQGFKSFAHPEELALGPLTVLVGANGAGKSNLISFFQMLRQLATGQLQAWVAQEGFADRILSFGLQSTQRLEATLTGSVGSYRFALQANNSGNLPFAFEETLLPETDNTWKRLAENHPESLLGDRLIDLQTAHPLHPLRQLLTGIRVYHFHNTSPLAALNQWASVNDGHEIQPSGERLAPYLYRLAREHPDLYEEIRQTLRMALPLFSDFVFETRKAKSGDSLVNLSWVGRESPYIFQPWQLSDGSLRFVALVAALMQPDPPTVIAIDEPELGLHPYALNLVAALGQMAARRSQVVFSTQSPAFVDAFSLDELIVIEPTSEEGGSSFRRLRETDYREWRDQYSPGELWQKNVLGGNPYR